MELTEEEREENIRLLEEIVEAEFPPDEMADATFRDKVCRLGLRIEVEEIFKKMSLSNPTHLVLLLKSKL